MSLNTQIVSFVVSFLYGIFFYILLEINTRFLYSSSLFVRLIVSFLFVLFNTLFYFIILMYVNNGYVHIYFFICVILGCLLCKVIYKRLFGKREM